MSSGSEMDYDDEQDYEKEDLGSDQFDQSEQGQSPMHQTTYADSEQKKLVIQQNENDKSCATYIFLDEDHTLGNSLRYVLIHRPDVEFCGYSLPHPSENKMNLRLQTIQCISTEQVLNDSLETLGKMCDILQNKFQKALVNYEQNKHAKI